MVPGKGPEGVLLNQAVAAHVSSTHSGSRSKGLHDLLSFLLKLQVLD